MDYHSCYAAKIPLRSMPFLRNFIVIPVLGLVAVSVAAQNRTVGSVSYVLIVNENPLQIQIQTTKASSPQVQLVSNPERLVIDIPNSVPGVGLHGLAVNRGGARAIRVGLFSAKPPITRVVVDLNTPESYRVTPNASGVLVSLGAESENAGTPQPAIGWVSAKARIIHPPPPVVTKPSSTQALRVNGARVLFSNGQLTIHAENATLSEVLFQIQKRTGAEIAIPSGTEQERVAADFGPGTPSEVMGQLLNGTGLNFVVVGSPSDPNQLRSVILSRKTGDADPPSAFQTVVNNNPLAGAVINAADYQDATPPPENAPQPPTPNGAPPAQQPPTGGPPPEQEVPD